MVDGAIVLSNCIACTIPGAQTSLLFVFCPNPACRCYSKERYLASLKDLTTMRRIHRWAWQKHVKEHTP